MFIVLNELGTVRVKRGANIRHKFILQKYLYEMRKFLVKPTAALSLPPFSLSQLHKMLETLPLLNMSNEAYHADTSRVSKSGLDLLARSPRHYWQKYLDPAREPETRTPALIIGSATHSAILEPDLFENEYCRGIKVNKATNAGKADWTAFLAANEGKEVLAPEDYDRILKMRTAVMGNLAACGLLREGVAEATLHFTHAETGVNCKVRLDHLHASGRVISDIKTTEDASQAAFLRSVVNYRYHVQAALYLDAFAYLGVTVPREFVFIAVEKTPPYGVATYRLDSDAIAVGRELYTEALQAYANAKAGGVWECYSRKIETLTLPGYALNK